jgi:hypothetical protein
VRIDFVGDSEGNMFDGGAGGDALSMATAEISPYTEDVDLRWVSSSFRQGREQPKRHIAAGSRWPTLSPILLLRAKSASPPKPLLSMQSAASRPKH